MEKESLTNTDAIAYLLSIQEDEKMLGRIRPISIHRKCSQCYKPFEEVPKLGYICREHKERPGKFYIDLCHDGIRYRIFSDKYDNVLDSYSAAGSLLKQINLDIEHHTFDGKLYIKKERENYFLEARWEELVNRHKNRKYLYQITFAEKYVFEYFRASQDIRDIKQSDISLFAQALPTLAKIGLGGKSIKNIIGVLLSLINYDFSIGLVPNKLSMPKINVIKKPKKIPELSESLKIVQYIDEKFRLIYLFLLTHLCRPADARALQAGHFSFSNNTVEIELGFSANQLSDTKTKKPYVIPIHHALIERLREICLAKKPHEFVFTYQEKRWGEAKLREVWNDAAKKAGLKITLYNGVKHASVSHVASESGDIYNTSKLTGHSSVSTTQIYAEKVRIEKLREIQSTIIIPDGLV
ncbi:MAG TPA: tyrosine-type recombinase/integrase [Thermodesulfovibrionales bacterium]|nr:tyrosine-type recombinase/integrase [Thermodesulfovibrionales bacterium]